MYAHNLSPTLFSIGPIEVRFYGLVYVLGFIGLYYGLRKLYGMQAKKADSLITWLIIGMLLGARSFFFAFYRPDLFSPLEFISIWNGGMSFHGALAGAGVAGWWWCKRNNENFWKIADISAMIGAFFLALGRVANFVNAEIIGTRFNGAWCVSYPNLATVEGCRHPVQLYAMVKNVIIGGVLVSLWRAKKFSDGFIFWMFALLYSVFRFIVNFWREDVTYAFGWLKMGHILTVALFIIVLIVLITYYREDLTKLFKVKSGKKKQ